VVPTFARADRDGILTFFKANLYAVIRDGMDAADVRVLNDFVDRSQQRIPDEWGVGKHALLSHGQILVEHPELDRFVQYPGVFELVRSILGDDIRFAQFDFRDAPPENSREVGMAFHQDRPQITRRNWDETHLYECAYACTITYLTDVQECCPCFCVVPNSHRYETMDQARAELPGYCELPIRGKAGTTILYNIAIYHTRLAGTCNHGRRTQHTYFSRAASPVLTNWALIPERLACHDDPATRAFYSQWTPAGTEYAGKHFARR